MLDWSFKRLDFVKLISRLLISIYSAFNLLVGPLNFDYLRLDHEDMNFNVQENIEESEGLVV